MAIRSPSAYTRWGTHGFSPPDRMRSRGVHRPRSGQGAVPVSMVVPRGVDIEIVLRAGPVRVLTQMLAQPVGGADPSGRPGGVRPERTRPSQTNDPSVLPGRGYGGATARPEALSGRPAGAADGYVLGLAGDVQQRTGRQFAVGVVRH